MYSNVASNFIMSFVSPQPSFATNNGNGGSRVGGGGNSYDDDSSNADYGNGGQGDSGGHSVNVTAFLACRYPNISIPESETSVSDLAGGLLGSHHNYHQISGGADTTGSPSSSYNGAEWEGAGNQDDWTMGGVARHPGAGEEDFNNNNYNNYNSRFSRLHEALPEFAANYADDGGGGDGTSGGNFCPRDWDDILCWPKTTAGEIATLPCFDKLHGITYNVSGFAKRLCMEGGMWNRTDYDGCKPFTPLPNITTDTGNLDITTGIYLFGYCLSLVALIIAAAIFISFKELRCLRNTIHSHLFFTYMLADALWVLSVISTDQGRTATQTTKTTCFTFILLHYFHLTNFFWMFVEGLYLYVLVVQTFMTESIRLRTYCVIGWGLPLLIVIFWSITKWATVNVDEATSEPARKLMIQVAEEVEFNSVACPWLHANQYDWIYIASALLVLAANLCFLLQIMWVLITKLRSATSQETQQSRKAAKALVVLMPLLGITYVLVLIGPKKLPLFEHTRAFFLSTQGFLVALLYCFLNAEVRMAIRHRWNRLECVNEDLKCCFCFSYSSNQQNLQNLRDWSPRSRTESIRLYTPTPSQHYRGKRESSASETTMMTAVGPSSFNNGGGGHGVSASAAAAGNGSTSLITTMTGRRISTTPLRPTTTFTEESDMV